MRNYGLRLERLSIQWPFACKESLRQIQSQVAFTPSLSESCWKYSNLAKKSRTQPKYKDNSLIWNKDSNWSNILPKNDMWCLWPTLFWWNGITTCGHFHFKTWRCCLGASSKRWSGQQGFVGCKLNHVTNCRLLQSVNPKIGAEEKMFRIGSWVCYLSCWNSILS